MIHKKKEQQVQAAIEATASTDTSTPNVRVSPPSVPSVDGPCTPSTTQFQGIAQAASASRFNAERRANGVTSSPAVNKDEKKIRWHGMVDTGMGRLGFKPEEDWSVGTIKKLHRISLEGGPLRFTGLCTHMADASSSSTFTQEQFARFRILLNRLRTEGVSVETVHTDNSSALLEKSLRHFDTAVLKQENVDSRGYVRCGGAIYGQRPQFEEVS